MVFILGLGVGSFINMAVYRTAIKYKLIKKRKSLLKEKRSFCDWCGKQLRWYENIPVLSWLIQEGRSKCCDNPLPREYPVVEIVTGVLFLLSYRLSVTDYQLILNLLIISLLIFSLVFDLKYMILPDAANYALTGLALVLMIVKEDYWRYLWSGIGSGLFFFLLNRIRIRGSEAMGMGDVKYVVFMGLFLGFPKVAVAGYLAFITGALVSVMLLMLKRIKKTDPVPFGPFLILGTGVVWIWGEKIVSMINLFK